MKAKKKLIALITVMLMVIMTVIPVSAGTTYTPVAGAADEAKFKKYLVMKDSLDVPAVEFEFSITPGAGVSENGKMEVLPGIVGATVGTAQFTATDTTYTTVQNVDISVGTLPNGYKYAKKEVTVDFSACQFPEPGIYRYNITENPYTGALDSVIEDQSGITYYMDVYVVDDGNGTLSVDGYVMHSDPGAPDLSTNNGSGQVSSNGTAVADKVDGFVNTYDSWDLYVGKTVEGNQGSRDKYFAFTIKVSGLDPDQELAIDLQNADSAAGSNPATTVTGTNPTTMEANADGDATATVYLQHDQYVVVKGIPLNKSYEVTEDAEDYKSEAINTTINSITFDDATSGTGIQADIHTGYTNTRDGIIPTGILLSATPWILIGVVVIAGLAFFAIRSRRKYDEE